MTTDGGNEQMSITDHLVLFPLWDVHSFQDKLRKTFLHKVIRGERYLMMTLSSNGAWWVVHTERAAPVRVRSCLKSHVKSLFPFMTWLSSNPGLQSLRDKGRVKMIWFVYGADSAGTLKTCDQAEMSSSSSGALDRLRQIKLSEHTWPKSRQRFNL